MSEKERAVGRAIADALKHLPEDKAEYFIGYAEGVRDAVEAQKQKTDVNDGKEEDK